MSRSVLLLLFFLILLLFDSSEAEHIAIYWGQDVNEGNLTETSATGKYSYVNVAFLSTFPKGGKEGYVDIGVDWGRDLELSKAKDQVLDGVDFVIEQGNTSFVGDLARYLSRQQPMYLSAAPRCPFPDAMLGSALDTGRFDYIWVQFYNNPSCDYTKNNVDNLLNTWNKWVTSLKGVEIFLGLVADQAAAPGGGYFPTDVLMSQILPAKTSHQSIEVYVVVKKSFPTCKSREAILWNGLIPCPPLVSKFMMATDIHGVVRSYVGKTVPVTYAAINHINNTGCQIWAKGVKFVGASGDIALPIYVSVAMLQEEHKGSSRFPTSIAGYFV
ncbi:Acidic endochitinase [Spatholobus suberectus]|nr:Acidic endochitinase [Spatholobus suberectus]